MRGPQTLTDLQRDRSGGAIGLLHDRARVAVVQTHAIHINRSESGDDAARDLRGRCLNRVSGSVCGRARGTATRAAAATTNYKGHCSHRCNKELFAWGTTTSVKEMVNNEQSGINEPTELIVHGIFSHFNLIR